MGGFTVLLALSPADRPAQAAAGGQEPTAAGASRNAPLEGTAKVLLIDSYDMTRPTFQEGVQGIRDVLNARVSQPNLLFMESLDLHRFPSADRRARTVERISLDYAEESISLIIATDDSTVALAEQLRARWGRDVPIVGLLTSPEVLRPTAVLPSLSNGVLVRLADMNMATARNIQALLPNVSEVWIIGQTMETVTGAGESMGSVFGETVRIEPFVSPNLEDLEARFAQLNEDAAIVYLSVGRDAQGRSWQIREYLNRLVRISPRPVFGWLGSYLGTGVLGGPVLDGVEIGEVLGGLAAEILNGTDPSRLDPVTIGETRLVYDWIPLRRFGIPLSRLPNDATVINRPLPVWESYPRISLAMSALIVLLLSSIAFLVLSRRRVRAVTAAQLAASRRLMQAQDEERMRIARDLHDDLCQEMMVLALEVEPPSGQAPPRTLIAERVRGLIDRTRNIAVGLHATHIGSLPLHEALAAHVAGVRARTGLNLQINTAVWESSPTLTVTIALFRVVQEALQNAIRHADASQFTVTIEGTPRDIRIEVTDDGIGFDPSQSGTGGLGLVSMRERMAAVGGTFDVHSTPFGGTTLRLSAPCEEAAP